MTTSLYQNWYQSDNPRRNKELHTCLQNNLNNPLIDRLFLLYEGDKPPENDRIIPVKSDTRPTVHEFFVLMDMFSGHEDINILANSDIYIPERSIQFIDKRLIDNKCLALSRYNNHGDHLTLYRKESSQDTWIIRGKPKSVELGNYHLGYLGCDNRLAWELHDSGYQVENPAFEIQTIHLHNSAYRTTASDSSLTVPPPYHLVPVTH